MIRSCTAVLILGLSWLVADAMSTASTSAASTPPAPVGLHELRLVPNLGQWDPEVRFAVHGADARAWIHADGFTMRLERWAPRDGDAAAARGCDGAIVRTRFVDAHGEAVAVGEPLSCRHHFYVGAESRWRSDVPAYRRARVRELRPGVDLMVRPAGTAAAVFEYDLLLAAGADLAGIEAECEGVSALTIDRAGALVMHVPMPDGTAVDLVQPAPVSWQDGPEGRRPVSIRFELRGPRRFGFAASALAAELPTTIDPGLQWSTLLGGGSSDSVNDMRWVPGQGLWVGGWAGSSDFPTTSGAFRTTGIRDGFVAKLAENGQSLVFATYLGGSAGEEVRALDTNAANEVYVGGWTMSLDFPTTAGAWRRTWAGASVVVPIGDGFITRLNANGSALLGSTFVGGVLDEVIEGLDVDAGGSVFAAGWTYSPDFPVTAGVRQTVIGGPIGVQTDGFALKLDAALSAPAWSTFMGSLFSDQLLDVVVDGAGQATVAGWSESSTWPTTPSSYRTTSGGAIDGVVSRLNSTGAGLVWSTYLGGIGIERVLSIDLASDGAVLLGGTTASTNFPTTASAPQRTLAGPQDGFISVLAANGQSLTYSTLLGGGGVDVVRGVTRDSQNRLFAVGETAGSFPTTPDAFQATYGGGSRDAFAALFAAGGATLEWSSYFGGAGQEVLDSVVVAGNGLAVLAGWTWSPDFPTTPGALQTVLRGIEDGVVLQLDLASSLEGFFGGESLPSALAATFVPGEDVELLAVRITNRTQRALRPRSVRLFVGGTGNPSTHADGLSLWRDDPATAVPRDQLLLQLPLPAATGEVVVDLGGLPVMVPDESADLRFFLRTRTDVPAGVEFAVAILDDAAWDVRPATSTQAVEIRSGRLGGPIVSAREFPSFPADADGDRVLTVGDLRVLCMRLGTPATGVDPDGNGLIDAADLDFARGVLLGRAVITNCPETFTRGDWVALRGWFPQRDVTITLGGRVLPIGTLTPRELTIRIDPALAAGAQNLAFAVGSRTVSERTVSVQ
ncbi:MAG: hypothetical protein IPK26_21040 [Planctomycetes bacterium]|nr:hypothetical protein [Planctomycetota bacterium]